ncbi:MAG: hypothetical protein ACTSQJ_18020, partial [Promethearchaeota archaeon]
MECKINDFISIRKENEKSIIYIKGVKFPQSKLLSYNLFDEDGSLFKEYKTIDEAADAIKHPTTQTFSNHCQALQNWAKNDYDTKLLHRVIAFPLLKKLVQVEDPIANKVFKQEIEKRFFNCELSVMIYLIQGGYLSIFSPEEKKELYENIEFKKIDNQKSSLIIPKLEKLIELGVEPLKRVLDEIMLKKSDELSYEDLNELLKKGYLKTIDGEERKHLIFNLLKNNPLLNKIAHDFPLYCAIFPLLKEPINKGNEDFRKLLFNLTLSQIDNEDPLLLRRIILDKYLTLLDDKEREEIINKIIEQGHLYAIWELSRQYLIKIHDYEEHFFSSDTVINKSLLSALNDSDSVKNFVFPLLRSFAEKGNETAKKLFKKEIINWIKKGDPEVLEYLNDSYYLKDYITERDLRKIFENP